MYMAINETGKDEFVAKIDKLATLRRIDEAPRDRFDSLTFDKYALLRLGRYVRIGEQEAGVNNLYLFRFC